MVTVSFMLQYLIQSVPLVGSMYWSLEGLRETGEEKTHPSQFFCLELMLRVIYGCDLWIAYAAWVVGGSVYVNGLL